MRYCLYREIRRTKDILKFSYWELKEDMSICFVLICISERVLKMLISSLSIFTHTIIPVMPRLPRVNF